MNNKEIFHETTMTNLELQSNALQDEELNEVTGGTDNINVHTVRHVHDKRCLTKPVMTGTVAGAQIGENGSGPTLFANTYCGVYEKLTPLWSCLRRNEVISSGKLCSDCLVLNTYDEQLNTDCS